MTFTTHDEALNSVADDWEQLARDIRKEDAYASHVSVLEKDGEMLRMMNTAAEIRKGVIKSFTIWQRVNEKITGECVAFLS